MRYIATVAALILSYGPTASYAQQAYVHGMGNNSCGKYSRPFMAMHQGKAVDLMIVGGENLLMIILFTWHGWADFLAP